MKTHKVTSAEDYKIVSSFQTVRKTLLDEKFADRLEKPLAYWAMPNDRRLPLAFLGRTIKDLLDTPFEELTATQGIGQKKISSLVKLLSRATKDHPPAVPFGMHDLAEIKRPPAEKVKKVKADFDPAVVSEALWTQWLQTVSHHELGREKLGRLAPTLQALPTVIWYTPLEFYMQYSVSEIRQLKTHGEKRVRVVLEIFYLIHEMLLEAGTNEHLGISLVPKFIEPIERWIEEKMAASGVPSVEEIRNKLTVPLLRQLHIDAGEPIFALSCGRLGIEGPPQSVRNQAKEMGVTRARVYQLLEECANIFEVRWPAGRGLLYRLAHKFHTEANQGDDLRSFHATLELFFPGKKGLADDDTADENTE